MITFSAVIPVYRGEKYLSLLMNEIDLFKKSLEKDNLPIRLEEVIFVDDCAIDGSSALIDEFKKSFDYVSALHLSRNFGQHPTTIAGILHTSSDWVVTLDEDLQHPPSRIIDLFQVVARDQADVVYGKPEGDVHQSRARDLTSRKYKALIERLTGNKHITNANSFRLMRGPIARAAASVCGYDTYFDVALSWFTQRIETKPMVLKDSRYIETGESGYNFRSLLSHARRMAFSSQIKLLRLGAVLGIAMLGLTFAFSIILVLLRVFVPSLIISPGWPSLMLTICFFGGAILFLAGILLEYMSILVMQAHGKPLFFTIDRSSDHLLNKLDVSGSG